MKYWIMLFAVALLGVGGCSESGVVTTRTVSLEIPKMECPFACWPSVKETLESEPGVGTVTLSEQKEEGVIDNRVVYVAVNDEFDAEHAIASLADAGFDGSFEQKQ